MLSIRCASQGRHMSHHTQRTATHHSRTPSEGTMNTGVPPSSGTKGNQFYIIWFYNHQPDGKNVKRLPSQRILQVHFLQPGKHFYITLLPSILPSVLCTFHASPSLSLSLSLTPLSLSVSFSFSLTHCLSLSLFLSISLPLALLLSRFSRPNERGFQILYTESCTPSCPLLY